jgi:hypothetical protein
MNAARPAGTSAANEAWNLSRSRNRKPSLGRQDRRLRPVGREAGDERVDRLVLVRRERADVDQGRHVRVGAGLADDGAAVGVADEHDRAVLRVDDQPRRGGVALQRQGGVLHHGHVVAVPGEQVIEGPPAGPVHETAVHQHDGRRWVCVHEALFSLPGGRQGHTGVSCLISAQRLVQAMEAACRSDGVGLESRIKFTVGHPPGCGLGLADARG